MTRTCIAVLGCMLLASTVAATGSGKGKCKSILPATLVVDGETHSVVDRYIVLLKPDADIEQHLAFVQDAHQQTSFTHPGFEGVQFRYNISNLFVGYSGHFHSSVVAHISSSPDISLLEKDHLVSLRALDSDRHFDTIDWPNDHNSDASCPILPPKSSPLPLPAEPPVPIAAPGALVTQSPSPAHLSAISHRSPLSKLGSYVHLPRPGQGTFAYIMDSGISAHHTELYPRVVHGWSAPSVPANDTLGHGTHVAALVGGRTFGVAKRTTLIDVHVFSTWVATAGSVFAGLDWAAGDIVLKRRQAKSVVNLSLGGLWCSEAWERAMEACFDKGVTLVLAAGNLGLPSGAVQDAIVVGATNNKRNRAVWSNWGRRVTVYAPGKVESAWIGPHGNETRWLRGTSQSAPIVSGVVAYLKGLKRLGDARATKKEVVRLATRGSVGNTCKQNLFVYNGSGK